MLMWDHEGKCPCGKRTFLFSQCPKCLKGDVELAGKAAEGETPVKEQEPTSIKLEPGAVIANGPYDRGECDCDAGGAQCLRPHRRGKRYCAQCGSRLCFCDCPMCAESYSEDDRNQILRNIGAFQQLPDVVESPAIKTGRITQYVEFFTEEGILAAHARLQIEFKKIVIDWETEEEKRYSHGLVCGKRFHA